jgi:hypothetical protein
MSELDANHIAWCRQHFDLIKDGGFWGFPSAGFLFRRRNGKLVLTERMPWQPEFPLNKSAWTKHQQRWLQSTVEHFAAGIEVIDATRRSE